MSAGPAPGPEQPGTKRKVRNSRTCTGCSLGVTVLSVLAFAATWTASLLTGEVWVVAVSIGVTIACIFMEMLATALGGTGAALAFSVQGGPGGAAPGGSRLLAAGIVAVSLAFLLTVGLGPLASIIALPLEDGSSYRGVEYTFTEVHEPGRGAFQSIDAADESHVWAVGAEGIDFYDGENWRHQYRVPDNPPGEPEFHFNDVDAVSAGEAWAVGERWGVFHLDGGWWAKVEVPGALARGRLSVAAVDGSHVWVTDGGDVFFFDGSGWSKQRSAPEATELNSISACDAEHVWMANGRELLFYNGLEWAPAPFGPAEKPYRVCALDPARVWAAGAGGTVWLFNGASWERRFAAGGVTMDVFASIYGGAWLVTSRLEGRGVPRSSWSVYRDDGSGWRKEYASPLQEIGDRDAVSVLSGCATSRETVWLAGSAILKGENCGGG